MKVSMPTGTSHGWGIAGSYLRAELARLPQLEGVTLHCIAGHDLCPFDESAWDVINIGYCFFEHELRTAPFMVVAAQRWDYIVAGSNWCEQQLRNGGVSCVSTIQQGVDTGRFTVQPPRPADGRFIVFSGGKFEFRKGQDIVIAAMRVFMQRHHDVWLSCAWHNSWPQSLRTMEQSKLIAFDWHPGDGDQVIRETVERNGIDSKRVLLHPGFDNSRMPFIYAESDIGLFPNRCEGGTNMVMCEYMACGRPVIASCHSGQADVISVDNAWPLSVYCPVQALTDGRVTGIWQEAQIDDLVEKLERAYADAMARQMKAACAAADMQQLSWQTAARKFYELGLKLYTERKVTGSIAITSREQSCAAADGLFKEERYTEAYAVYTDLLQDQPLNPELLNRIGTTLDRLGRHGEAVAYYHKVLCHKPGLTGVRHNLANSLRHLGKEAEAEKHLIQVIQEDPGFAEGWKRLAMVYVARNASVKAVECFESLTRLEPFDMENFCALGALYAELGRSQEAVCCFETVLSKQPEHVLALETLGTVLHELEELERAESCYRKVLAIESGRVSAINNLGTVLRSQNRLDEAIEMFDQALSIDPGNGQVRFNRGCARLTRNELPEAWEDYEARFSTVTPPRLSRLQLPRWDGGALNGKRLLVQSEQGFGDTFQFVRYLPILAGMTEGQILFECQNRSVLQALNGISGVEIGVRGEALPVADCQIPLASLPYLFKTDLSTIPSPEGYLKPPVTDVALWQRQIDDPTVLNIGLVWGGNKNSLNANRSLQLKQLEYLFNLPGIRWYSLQVGDDAKQLEAYKEQITDLGRQINHFGDTAAIISCLDLVLTIDTAVAHLAGALGAPVWIMLKYAPDWRWSLGRSDSPWYHSAVLFRQPQTGNWDAVISGVREKLALLLDDHKKRAKVCSATDEESSKARRPY